MLYKALTNTILRLPVLKEKNVCTLLKGGAHIAQSATKCTNLLKAVHHHSSSEQRQKVSTLLH